MKCNRLNRRWWLAAGAVFGVAALTACTSSQDAGYQGYVEGEYLYLAAPSPGYLDALQAPRGSRVDAGQMVFTVASDPEQHDLQSAQARQLSAQEQARNLDQPRRQSEVAAQEAQVRAAQAALTLSQTQLKQQTALAQNGFVSSAALDVARAAQARDQALLDTAMQQLATTRATLGRVPELRAAQANVLASQADVAQKRWQLDKKQVSAPQAGEISDTYYRPGEWVPAGQPVASLLPDSLRRVRFFVPETVVATVHLGQVVHASCDGCAAPVAATVNFISAQAEYTPPVIYSRGSREKLVFRVEAKPALADAVKLRPGLPVDVVLK